MERRKLLGKSLLLVTLIWAMVGCGGQDEAQPVSQANQTPALVPEAADLNDDVEPINPPGEASFEEAVQGQAAVHQEPAAPPAGIQEEPPSAEAAQTTPPAPPEPISGGRFSLQLGSYTVSTQAEEKAAQLRDLGYPATVEQAEVRGQLYHRVFIRGLPDRQSAEKLGEDLHSSLGLSYLIRRK